MRAVLAMLCLWLPFHAGAQEIRMLKSLSGVSGHVAGSKFVFDETRERFVYPQDKSLTVYFEWSAPPGLHTITAVWKSPDGRPASIPTDIKIETQTPTLTAYWVFDIRTTDPTGIWTLETRVDGMPAGSHTFELYVPAEPAALAKAPEPQLPTTDEAYRATVPSLVVVHSLDSSGHRLDTGLGFVYAQDRIATAFQSIDGASSILVEFSDGASTRAIGLAGYQRFEDWALIPVPTGARAPLKRSSSGEAQIGERVLAFTLENEKNIVAAVVNVVGRSRSKVLPSIRINPALPAIAAGSPVLDPHGDVFGILGAWDIPGSRIPDPIRAVSPTVWEHQSGNPGAVTPIAAVKPANPTSLDELTKSGVFTPPLERFPSLTYATTTDVGTKRGDLPDRNVTEFPRKLPVFWVVSLWDRREKMKSAVVSVAILDLKNQKRGESDPKKVSLGDTPYRLVNAIPLDTLEPGTYRIELRADGRPVWRTYVRILD